MHASKILASIMYNKNESKMKTSLTEEQLGLRKGKESKEALLSLRLIMERIAKHKETCFGFVDIEKAFDNEMCIRDRCTHVKCARVRIQDYSSVHVSSCNLRP